MDKTRSLNKKGSTPTTDEVQSDVQKSEGSQVEVHAKMEQEQKENEEIQKQIEKQLPTYEDLQALQNQLIIVQNQVISALKEFQELITIYGQIMQTQTMIAKDKEVVKLPTIEKKKEVPALDLFSRDDAKEKRTQIIGGWLLKYEQEGGKNGVDGLQDKLAKELMDTEGNNEKRQELKYKIALIELYKNERLTDTDVDNEVSNQNSQEVSEKNVSKELDWIPEVFFKGGEVPESEYLEAWDKLTLNQKAQIQAATLKDGVVVGDSRKLPSNFIRWTKTRKR